MLDKSILIDIILLNISNNSFIPTILYQLMQCLSLQGRLKAKGTQIKDNCQTLMHQASKLTYLSIESLQLFLFQKQNNKKLSELRFHYKYTT